MVHPSIKGACKKTNSLPSCSLLGQIKAWLWNGNVLSKPTNYLKTCTFSQKPLFRSPIGHCYIEHSTSLNNASLEQKYFFCITQSFWIKLKQNRTTSEYFDDCARVSFLFRLFNKNITSRRPSCWKSLSKLVLGHLDQQPQKTPWSASVKQII